MHPISLDLSVLPQPDEVTCGPTCLHAMYAYFGDPMPLETVIRQAPSLDGGGTLAVLLGSHALRRGYRATLYSFNLNLLDPTWFDNGDVDVIAKLEEQARIKPKAKLRLASTAYAEFLRLGGELRMRDLTPSLIHGYLARGLPVLAGASATYLYRCARELDSGGHDDLRGTPQGHFVLLTGYRDGEVQVADPWQRAPLRPAGMYWIPVERLVTAILLGVLTYDGNLLVIESKT